MSGWPTLSQRSIGSASSAVPSTQSWIDGLEVHREGNSLYAQTETTSCNRVLKLLGLRKASLVERSPKIHVSQSYISSITSDSLKVIGAPYKVAQWDTRLTREWSISQKPTISEYLQFLLRALKSVENLERVITDLIIRSCSVGEDLPVHLSGDQIHQLMSVARKSDSHQSRRDAYESSVDAIGPLLVLVTLLAFVSEQHEKHMSEETAIIDGETLVE